MAATGPRNPGTARVGLFTKILGTLGIKFNDTNQTQIVMASADPTITAINAPAGSVIFYPAGPQWYLKKDAGSTTNCVPIDMSKLNYVWGQTGWSNGGSDNVSTITNCSLSLITANTQLRLTLAAAHKIYIKGREVNLPSGNYDAGVDSGAAGLRVFYFDDASGTLKKKASFFSFPSDVCVAYATWNGASYDNLGWELHTTDTSPANHFYEHNFFGCQYLNGLASTYITYTDNNTDEQVNANQTVNGVTYVITSVGNTNWTLIGAASNTLGLEFTATGVGSGTGKATPSGMETAAFSTGNLYDEDIPITIGTLPWNGVTLGNKTSYVSGLSCPFYYYNGATFTRVAPHAGTAGDERTIFPFSGANGLPQWNSGSSLVASVTGDYLVYWVYGSSLLGADSVFIRPHNAKFASLVLAQAASDGSLQWTGFPSPEAKLLYRFIVRASTAYTSIHRSKIVDVKDFRVVAGSPLSAVTATDHASLNNRAIQNQHPSLAIAFPWVTGTTYAVGNLVTYNNMVFSCLVAHTAAAAFLTDFAAANWQESAKATQNRQDNTSASSGVYASDAFPSVSNLQSATFTMGLGGTSYMLSISVSNGKCIVCVADYNSAVINCISDQDAQFLATDAGTGIVVTKTAGSAVITVKNRTGGAVNIGVLPSRVGITAATAWV